LLGLQWADLNLSKRTLLVRAVEQGARKTSQPRQLPVSARLAAVFEMARLDLAGRPYPLTAYVFGQLGRRVRSIKKAWETCVLRAHGYTPTWSKRGHKLSEEARAALRGVDLHFHDLRHEAGCRWLEAGWPIHHVQEMLGHSNLSHTSTYLHANEMGLQESMKKFDDARCTSVAPKISHFCSFTAMLTEPSLSNAIHEGRAEEGGRARQFVPVSGGQHDRNFQWPTNDALLSNYFGEPAQWFDRYLRKASN
jgi:hypothetical protein